MKKFLDITGLKTLVDWIKSKFNSIEKEQYVANRSFKKYTRKKRERDIYYWKSNEAKSNWAKMLVL